MEPGWGGGRCLNGVQHTGIKFPSYLQGGGGGQSGQGLLVLPPHSEIFSGENPGHCSKVDFSECW